MNTTTVAVELAKSVFQLAVADTNWRVVEQHRITRSQFERWFINRNVSLVIMEACGSAHHWARQLNALGIEVKLLPAVYIRAYVKRNKTDAADACVLLEAARCADIAPVKIKSVEQQALQGLQVRINQIERGLTTLAKQSQACTTLLSIPGVGLLTATAMVRGYQRQCRSFQGCATFRQLVWIDAQGALVREQSQAGTNL